MALTTFLDFDLLLERLGETYRARVLRSPAGEVVEESASRPGFFDLEEFLRRIGRPSRSILRDARPVAASEVDAGEALRAFGTTLFEAAFPGQVGTALEQSIAAASRQKAGLRIRLRLSDVPELAGLPWEFLYNPASQNYVTLSAGVCLARYPELLQPVQPLAVTPPLQVLVVIANPSDQVPLDVDKEWLSLKEAVAELEEEGRVNLCRLQDATLPALQGALRRDDFHILHFIGHGDFDRQQQKGVLLLEDESGRSSPVLTEELSTLLRDELQTLRLVLLNTCKGACSSPGEPYAGLAQGLLQQGVPVVVAMQLEVSDRAAITFAREFYRSVADGFPIDYSVGEGRKAIYVDDNAVEWGVPVLFMRSPDGHIFEMVEQEELPARGVPAWQRAAWRYLVRNRVPLLTLLVLQVVMAGCYLALADRYLIPWWRWVLAAVLGLVAVGGWRRWERTRPWNLRMGLALLTTVGLLALVGWQSWHILRPRPFAEGFFGIAVAEMGEGAGYSRTARARELSSQVYDHLCAEVNKQYPGESCEEPRRVADASGERTRVVLRRVGVMPDVEAAERYAGRLEARVIVWGQVLTTRQGGVTIHFHLIESQDRALGPEVPLVLPVSARTADLYQPHLDLDSAAVKGVIAQQSALVADFAFGLEALYDLHYPQAATHFEAVVRAMERGTSLTISPTGKSLLYFYLGRAYQGLGELDEGREWLELAAQENPVEPAVPMALALGHGSLGEEEERDARLRQALDLVNAWLRTHPEDNTARYDRGIIYEMLQEYEDAFIDLEQVIQRDPEYYVAHISLALNATKLGRHERAIDALQTAIKIADRSGARPGWAHLNLARIYEKLGRLEEARSQYEAAIDSIPKSWMYYSYAGFLESQGESEAALAAYQTMTEVSLDPAWAYGKLGDFLQRQAVLAGAAGDGPRRRAHLAAAREAYKTAVHDRPQDPLLHAYLAEVSCALGQDEGDAGARQGYFIDCREEYARAQAYGPDLYYVYSSYANSLFQMGDFEAAAANYERSLELRPLDWGVLLNLGWAYEQLGQAGEAEAAYRRILALAESFPEEAIQEANDRLRAMGVVGGSPEPQ